MRISLISTRRMWITSDIWIAFIALSIIIRTSTQYHIQSGGDALDYLSHFGYLHKPELESSSSLDEAVQAVKEFQNFANIIPNGRLNPRTLREMNKPRCGNRDGQIYAGDELGIDKNRRKRRETSSETSSPGVRWHKRILTYRVAKFSSSFNLKPKTLQKEIDLAFKYWEREANLTFKKIWEGKPDIEISFVTGDHGDEESFDGPSKTLAHAFYPARSDIHFDDSEKWTANARHGHNLRTVAVHEIGHSLGLGHSKEKKSVMYLMYQGFKDKLQLHVADINAIQILYGPKLSKDALKNENALIKASSKFQKFAGMMISNPDLCMNGSIDAISALEDGFVYIFKGEYFYRFKMGELIQYSEYPRRINVTFANLPSNLDTVLTIPSGKTYFFKGRLYWRSTGTKMDPGYPKKIAPNFLGIPNNLDGSFTWSWNNMVYFFKKNRYWRYNFETPNKRAVPSRIVRHHNNQGKKRNSTAEIIEGYPKRISTNWPGIPDSIDDAFKAPNGRTYIFKNGEYWQFHDPDSDIEAASYPRSAGEWWFGCSDFVPDARKVRHARKRKPFNYL